MSIVNIKDCGQGVLKDPIPEEIGPGAWSDCVNMRFCEGFAERFKGMQPLFADPLVVPYWVSPYVSTLTRFWIHAGLQQVFADDGLTRTEITRYTEGQAIASITFVTTTATLTTSTAHGRTTGDMVSVYNALPDQYNGTFAITVTSPTVFTYTMAGTPATAATIKGAYSSNVQANFTGAIDDRWTGGSLNGVFICNNKADTPQYWGGSVSTKLRGLPGWDSTHRAGWMRPWKSYILCGDITKAGTRYPSMLKWSTAAVPGAVPESWDTADATQDAGEVDLAETPDVMVDALPLGNALIVYKERSMYSVTETFDNRIFKFSRLPGTTGMLARGCAANTPQGHVVLTAGDLILHNGQSSRSLVSGKMRKWLFGQISDTLYSRCFLAVNPPKQEVWICFPTADSQACNTALVWNWESDTFGLRTLQNVTYGDSGQVNSVSSNTTWDADADVWSQDGARWDENEYAANEARLIFSHLTRVSLVDSGTTDFGANIVSSLERRGMSFDDPYTVKVIRAIYPRIEAAAGTPITVQVGSAQTVQEIPKWSAPVTFIVGTGGQIKVNTFSQAGRFLALRISNSSLAAWRIRSLDLDIKTVGAY